MKRKLVSILAILALPFSFYAQEEFNTNSPQAENIQQIEWGTESHVIQCSSFSISAPLSDLSLPPNQVQSKAKKNGEAPDKRDMPVQTFPFNVKDNGAQYGNDPAIIQTQPGNVNARPENKALEQNWLGQAPSVGFRPYDPSGAPGPNHYVQAINGDTYRIWNKTGTLLASGNISALFPSGNGDGDPIVLYDKAADRWFMSQFAGGGGGNGIYIAVSQTGDPLGSWYTYEFSSPDFPDYLKFSAWQDGYYMTANYAQKIFAFNRTKMLAGDGTAEAVYQTFSPPQSGFFVPLPADASDGVMPGGGTPCPIFSYSDDGWGGGNIDAVNIYEASVTWGGTPNLTVTSAGALPTSAFDGSYDPGWDDIDQPGTGQKLDGIGGAMMFRAQWKTWAGYNTVVLNWAVQVTGSQRGIFWCELRQNQTTNVWSIYQQGIYAPGTDSYWMGSIGMNDQGDIALSYAKGSSSTYMTLGYVGRYASDPLGTLPIAETIAIAGTGSQTGMNRVGDYAQLCLDPDGETFWYTGEYLASGGSPKTRVYSYTFAAPCTPPTSQATSFNSSAIGDNQMTVSWTNGNGNARIVLVHESAVVDANPGSGNSYTANSIFGSGDQIGTDNFVVYNGTGTSVTVTGLTPGTTYYYSVFEYDSAIDCYLTPALTGSATTTGVAPCSICADVTSTNDDATGFTDVTFNTISNTSSGDPEYTDYTSISTDVNVGQSYDLSVEVNTAGNYTTETKAWIDWNQDCDFLDAGEEYDLGTATNVTSAAPSLSPVSITIPGGAALGNTVMRIRTTWDQSGTPVPCGNQNYSEAEDYTINVVDPNSPPVASFSAGSSSVCAGESIAFTDNSTGSPTSWAWDFGDGGTSTNQNPTYSFLTAGNYTVSLTATNADGSDVSTTSITVNALPSVSAGSDQSVCDGNQVTLNGSGATSYSWNNGVTDGTPFTPSVGTTNYTVTGTDGNGCQNTDVVAVTAYAIPSITSSATNPSSCGSSTGSVVVSGSGTGVVSWTGSTSGSSGTVSLPYTITNLAAGTYNVTFTSSNSCVSNTTSEALSDPGAPSAPTITAGGSTTICSGESVTLTNTYSTGVLWSNGATTQDITVTAAGNYSVTYTDINGCSSSSAATTVVVNSLPTVDAGTNQDVCEGTQITLSGNGASTYSWDNGVSDGVAFTPSIGTTTYTVTGTDANGCTNTDQVDVTVNALPTLSTTPTDIGFICTYEAPITLVGDPSGGTFTGNGVSGNVFDPNIAGIGTHTITYSYTDGNGCENTITMTAHVDGCLGVDEVPLEGVTLFPNPNNGEFVITGLEIGEEFSVFDNNGRLVHTGIADSESVQVNLPDVESSIYYLQSTKGGKEGRIKFLVTH